MTPLHVAKIYPSQYLFLREVSPSIFQWFHVKNSFKEEEQTTVAAPSLAEAIKEGYKKWDEKSFRLVHCGFRYSLPERDEVGTNALFRQMVLSYSSFNGRYFDEGVGHLCYVDFASEEALEIWKKIR